MKTRTRFIFVGVLLALAIFPVWRYFIQEPYLRLLGWIVAGLGGILPYGKTALSSRIVADVGEIAFDLFDFRKTVVIDVSSIVTNVVPLLALVIATPISVKKRLIGVAIGIGVALLSHIFAASIILWWQVKGGTGALEGLKTFTDGVLIAALPLLYWAVWADYAKKGGLRAILSN